MHLAQLVRTQPNIAQLVCQTTTRVPMGNAIPVNSLAKHAPLNPPSALHVIHPCILLKQLKEIFLEHAGFLVIQAMESMSL